MADGFNQHLDYEDLTDHDRPLGFHWNVPGLARDLGLSLPRKLEVPVSSVLAEAILAAESGRAVSYSRNRNFYANSQRYRGTEYTYSTVLASVALLHRAGWIVDRPAPPGQLGWQSSLVATPQLIRAGGSFGIPITYTNSEIIWLKDDAGDLVNYIDTRNTRRLRHELAECNQHLAQLAIEVPGAEWRGHHMLIDRSYILPIPGNPLRRIFSRSRFSLHGRIYGWY
jgi:hypothetical protein